MRDLVLGWDLGGAHVKVAALNTAGRVERALQVPCPLWQGIAELDRAVQAVLAQFPAAHWHAVTMTGELADLFSDRVQGVASLLARFGAHVPPARTLVYAYGTGFVSPLHAKKKTAAVASANWAASAAFTAGRMRDALLIDVGSTTTDIVPIRDGKISVMGETDAARLAHEELIYTGVVRTPIMALAERIACGGAWITPMAEHFATTADVYRLTGELPEGADQLPAADNGRKTVRGSARRLARMVGQDAASLPLDEWRRCAAYLADLQLWQIRQACERVLSRGVIASRAPLVGAGVGRFLVAKLAQRLGRRYRDFGDLVPCANPDRAWVSSCAPAVAVAALAREALHNGSGRTTSGRRRVRG